MSSANSPNPDLRQPDSTPGKRKAASRNGRTRAREFALQALYQFLIGKNPVTEIDSFTRELSGFAKADGAHFERLLYGCTEQCEALDAQLVPLLDRPLSAISPIEHAVLWLGLFELQHCLEVPWRVVLNEFIELAKSFGGSDGHKYVNAVLNALAQQLRALEIAAQLKPDKVNT